MTQMTVKHLEQLQATLNQAGYDYQLELEDGKIIVVVEIKSQSDRIKPLKEKIQMFLSLGAVVGILIDPDKETVTVYRPTGEPTVLSNGDILTIPELFPGLEFPISELWPPVFDEEE
jgi:Uma2 family endonuclease